MPQGIFSRRMSPHQKRLRSLWEVGFPKGRCSGTSLVTQTVLWSFARKEWEVVDCKWPGYDELLSVPVLDLWDAARWNSEIVWKYLDKRL